MSQSDDDRKNGSPDISDWAAINTVQPADRKQIETLGVSAQPKQFSVPQEVQSIDFTPTGYRSYTGLVILGIVGLIGAGLYYGYAAFPTSSLDEQKPILLTSTQKLDRTVEIKSKVNVKRTVEFSTQPPGASVILNGNPLPSLTPTTGTVSSDLGGQVRFTLSGYADEFVGFSDSQETVEAVLTQAEHKSLELKIESQPMGASVSADGVSLGITPLTAKIEHHAEVALKLDMKGHYPHMVIAPVGDRETVEIGQTLLPGITPRTLGNIKVITRPENAMVERKNSEGLWIKAGRSGFDGIKLVQTVGMPISFRASADGYTTKVFTLDVVHPFYTVNLYLEEAQVQRGDLQITGSSKLMVFLDSEELDALPQLAKQRKAGVHKIVIVDPKTRKRLKTTVTVVANQTTSYKVESSEKGLSLTKH